MNRHKRTIPPQPEPEQPNEVYPPTKAGPDMVCQPHRERTGATVPADIVTGGTAMCRACFRGRPIDSVEERIALPLCSQLYRLSVRRWLRQTKRPSGVVRQHSGNFVRVRRP